MKKYTHYLVVLLLLLSTLFTIIQTVTAEENDVVLEYFYTKGCHACNSTKSIIDEIENDFNGKITIIRYLVIKNQTLENYSYFHDYYGFTYVPAVVVYNQTNQTNYVKFNYSQIKKSDIEKTIESFGTFLPQKPKEPESAIDIIYLIPFVIIAIIILIVAVTLSLKNRKKGYDS